MKKKMTAMAVVAALVSVAGADVFTTSYGTVSGADDANQAGPMFGQGINLSVGTTSTLPATVYLQEISFSAH